MKEIKLLNNKGITFIDDEDYKKVSKYKWGLSGKGYVSKSIKIGEKWHSLYLHRFLLNTLNEIDHIDRNPLNNQKENLRIVTRSQNNMNKCKQKGKWSSSFKRVSKVKNNWTARTCLNEKFYCLGTFENEIDAAIAYNKKALELFGEYAYLNGV